MQEDPVRVEIQLDQQAEQEERQVMDASEEADASFLGTLQDVAQEMLPEWDSLLDTEGPGQQEEAAPAMAVPADIDPEKPIVALTFPRYFFRPGEAGGKVSGYSQAGL